MDPGEGPEEQMADDRQIYFHIGAHKTASSFLQANLAASREGLSHAGLDVILRRHVLRSPFGREVYAVSQGTHDPGSVTPEALQNIQRLISRHQGHILITNEDMVSSLQVQDFYQHVEKAARYILGALPDFEVHFILYIRRQPDYLESVYMQYVHLGRSLKFGQFMERAEGVDLSWLRVVNAIAAGGVPRDRIAVRPFERIRERGSDGFLREFLALCGVEDTDAFSAQDDTSRGRVANRSYGELGMRIARQVNPMLNDQERKLLRRFLQENFSTASHPRAELLTPEARQELFDRYAPSNRELFESHDLGGPGDVLGYY